MELHNHPPLANTDLTFEDRMRAVQETSIALDSQLLGWLIYAQSMSSNLDLSSTMRQIVGRAGGIAYQISEFMDDPVNQVGISEILMNEAIKKETEGN